MLPVTQVLKEVLKRLKSKKLMWAVLGMIATSVGMFGGFPEPPKLFLNIVDKYPLTKWFLVYVLIFQGMAGGDKYWALIGTVATYVLYKVMEYLENYFDDNVM